MPFLSDCHDTESMKTLYRKLVKLFHPDQGGDRELFEQLQREYESWQPPEQTEEEKRYYQGFSYNRIKREGMPGYNFTVNVGPGGYRYNPAGNINNAYFNRENQSLHNEISCLKTTIEVKERTIRELKIIQEDLSHEIKSLKKNYFESLKEVESLKKRSLWQYLKMEVLSVYEEYRKNKYEQKTKKETR